MKMRGVYVALAEKLAELKKEEFNRAVEGNPSQPHEVVENVAVAIAELLDYWDMSFFDHSEFLRISEYVNSPEYDPRLDDS
jgi:hypothetical protein